MEEQQDVTQVEETTASPSEEIKPAETPQEPVVDKTVPYQRFKEVNDKYKELLNTAAKPIAAPEPIDNNLEEAVKIIDSRAENIVARKFEQVNRKSDLDKTIGENPDFWQFHDAIKGKLQENPGLMPSDAYKLVKYDVNTALAREQGKQEAYQKIEMKKSAMVESPAVAKAAIPKAPEAIDPLAKGPDGKFLFSTKDLEELLPKR